MRYLEKTFSSKDGLNLFFRDYGPEESSPPPVLCLPGLTRNSRDFEALARRLADGRRVICPDLRGRGFSEWDSNYRNYQPAVYVDDLIRLLESEKIARVVFLGTSLGGFLAMIIAASRPDLATGVIVNDAGPEVDPKGLARISQYVGTQAPAPSWKAAAEECRRTYGAAFPGLSDGEWVQYARQGYRQDKDGVILLDMDPRVGDAVRELDATPEDLWPVFSALSELPMLVIRGANSDILSEETLAKMAEEKPDVAMATIPDRGHAPMLNEKESLEAIEQFLDRLEM